MTAAGKGAAGRLAPAPTADDTKRPAILARNLDLFDSSGVPLGGWPNPETLEARFLVRLLRGGEITSRDWLTDVHSMRLATEAHQLRMLGWSVRTRRVTVQTADRGRLANIGSYRLDQAQREAALESLQGRAFVAAVSEIERRPA